MAYEDVPTAELEGMAMDMAAQVDQNDANIAMARAPEGDFSVNRLNAVVDALNDVLELFPGEEMYPSFDQEVDIFPEEFVTTLDMVNAAATDADIEDGIVALEEISDDTDLAKAAGQLKSLAKNKEFKKFLKEQYTAPVEEEVVEEVPVEEEVPVDDLFMERM